MELLDLLASDRPLEILGDLRETRRVKAAEKDARPLVEAGLVVRKLEAYELTERGREAIDVVDVVRASLVHLARAPDPNVHAEQLLGHLRRHYD